MVAFLDMYSITTKKYKSTNNKAHITKLRSLCSMITAFRSNKVSKHRLDSSFLILTLDVVGIVEHLNFIRNTCEIGSAEIHEATTLLHSCMV